MRYPLWAFLVIFVVPPFTAHALLSGRAQFQPAKIEQAVVSDIPVHYHRL